MRQLSIENGNRHFLPWGAVVLKNCDPEGNLLHFDILNTYKHQQLPLWVVLTLYLLKMLKILATQFLNVITVNL